MRTSYVPTSKVEAVRRLPAFAGCTDRELAGLCQEADELDFLPGAVLMREGDRSGEVFLILSGRVQVVHCGAIIASVGAGETVGEMGMIDSGPRSATVRAETPVRALVFGRRQVGGLLGQAGPARAVAGILSHRLRHANGSGLPRLSPVA
jgi:CRP-like cAMP-binding protein